MMKLETHAHCKGGSRCAIAPVKDLIDDYKKEGYGGVVLTSHICETYYNDYPGDTHKEKIDFYMSLYYEGLEYAKTQDMKFFWGCEVKTLHPENLYMEYMLYGVTEKMLYDNKPFFTLSQQELFRFAEKNNVFMYQSHPFRNNVYCGDPKFMHGAESFNGHFHHINNNALAKELCQKHNLLEMSGTDYHGVGQPCLGGIYVPDDISDMQSLVDYLWTGKAQLIENEEIYQIKLNEWLNRK